MIQFFGQAIRDLRAVQGVVMFFAGVMGQVEQSHADAHLELGGLAAFLIY